MNTVKMKSQHCSDPVYAGAMKDGYHHGDLAEALVHEAREQVRAQGAEAVSLRAVAHALGVSPSAAYHHFPDKIALLTAVGREAMDDLDQRMLLAYESTPGSDAPSAMARFAALGLGYIQFSQDEPNLFRHAFGPLCALGHEEKIASMDTSSAYMMLNKSIDDLVTAGVLTPANREGLDLLAWTMVHGLAMLSLDGFLPVELGPVLLQVLGGLVTRQASTAAGAH